jgi:YbbR domain-containing protein
MMPLLERLLANWPLKAVSLVLAYVIWVAITGETHIVRVLDIPVDVRLGANRALSSAPPTTVTVRLRGPETMIRKLDALRLALVLDLGDAATGERDVLLTRDELSGVPETVEVSFIPDRVKLAIEERARVELPIRATLHGDPAEGYHVYRARTRPRTLEVQGPRSRVEPLDHLGTDVVQLDGQRETFVQVVNALPDHEGVEVVGPARVEVRVVIDRAPVKRTFGEVPVVIEGAADAASAEPRTVRVTLSGPPGLLERIAAAEVRAVADVATTSVPRGGTASVPLRVDLGGLSTDERDRVDVSLSRRMASVRATGGGSSR